MIDEFFRKSKSDIDRDIAIQEFNREARNEMNRRAEQLQAEKQQRELAQWQERAQRLARDKSDMAVRYSIDLEIVRRRAVYAVVSQILWGALVFVAILTILLVLGGVL